MDKYPVCSVPFIVVATIIKVQPMKIKVRGRLKGIVLPLKPADTTLDIFEKKSIIPTMIKKQRCRSYSGTTNTTQRSVLAMVNARGGDS